MTVAQDEGLRWLQSLPRFGIRPGLSRTQKVLSALGHPETALKFFHVAGTNGKGSVCSYLHSLLSINKRVGLFTSPAYDGFRARFRIGRDLIDPVEFGELSAMVMEVSAAVTPDDGVTEFEALTIMAIVYFARHAVDGVVWETGLGGRYDSTNVVTPVVSSIVNVGLDHMDILGHTVRAIAADKAGILKASVPSVTGAIDSAKWEIMRHAHSVNSQLFTCGTHFDLVREQFDEDYQRASYRGISRDIFNLQIPLFGKHQCANAAIALAMMEVATLAGAWHELGDSEIRLAIQGTRWPGRFERIYVDGTCVILDGAHNTDGAQAFRRALKDYAAVTRHQPPWPMVVGILADKEISTMLHAMLPLASKIFAVAPNNQRAMPAADLATAIRRINPGATVEVVGSIDNAVSQALCDSEGGPVIAWGSLYTVDEVRQALTGRVDMPMGVTG